MIFKDFFLYPKFPKSLEKLYKIAYNLWVTWDNEAYRLFMRIDSKLFRICNKNPVLFLMKLSEEKLNEIANDKAFLYNLEKVSQKFDEYLKFTESNYPDLVGKTIAYFSTEYGLHQALPIYAGGLGILSGDYIKGASDLNIPIVSVGLFYNYGYFNQRINVHGIQEEIYLKNNPYFLPLKEIKDKSGNKIYLQMEILNKLIKIKLWELRVGQNRIILLDTNLEENPQEFRDVTDQLYVADREKRLVQEIVLGIGGIKALNLLGIKPDIYHLNEGHSALMIIERLRELILDYNFNFDEAYEYIKLTNIFTTHTPVEAGNENFDVLLVKKYLENYIKDIGINFDKFISYGFLNDKNKFWLPTFAIRFSNFINGVSKIHCDVSKKMWSILFPNLHQSEIPIIGITNSVHYSWLSPQMQYLFERYISPNFYHLSSKEKIWENIFEIPDEEIWDAHVKRKKEMISFIRKHMSNIFVKKGYSSVKIESINKILNLNYLTIGFARRFATYKRANLILKDKSRLKRILTNPEKPIQLIFAGKAHPADLAGKNLIKEVIDFAKEYGVEDRVIFVEDYDIEVAKHLVQGVDVWLNNPVKPNEASGTSGMKAGINGVLNLSVLDGWWPECFDGENGWAISAGENISDPELRDVSEANQIYEYLENEIANIFYDRNENDIPENWIKMMKNSIYSVYKNFNMNRMLEDYVEKFYLKAIKNNEIYKKSNFYNLKILNEKYYKLINNWNKIYFKDLFTDNKFNEVLKSDDEINFECYIYLDDLDENLIDVEIFYLINEEQQHEICKLNLVEKYNDKVAKYSGKMVLKGYGIQKYNVRIVPKDKDLFQIYPDLVKWYY